jgi:hypothetical protein
MFGSQDVTEDSSNGLIRYVSGSGSGHGWLWATGASKSSTKFIVTASIDHHSSRCGRPYIELERQWHNRMAGLRSNTLVAIGGASFGRLSRFVAG